MYSFTRTILCVDDDPDDREMVCYTIGEIDPTLQVVHAEDGMEALHFLKKAEKDNCLPCLVILDINMPRMDGKEALAQIKKDKGLNKVPIVIFSTSSTVADKKYCDSYKVKLITKPSTMHSMKEEVRRFLQPCAKE